LAHGGCVGEPSFCVVFKNIWNCSRYSTTPFKKFYLYSDRFFSHGYVCVCINLPWALTSVCHTEAPLIGNASSNKSTQRNTQPSGFQQLDVVHAL
jgi:hypothetical protein